MSKKQKTTKEKLMILREAEEVGVMETCRKYNVHPSTYYNWLERYELSGLEGLKSKTRIDPELRRLREENDRLKKLVGDKELSLQIKDALLKKVYQREKKDLW